MNGQDTRWKMLFLWRHLAAKSHMLAAKKGLCRRHLVLLAVTTIPQVQTCPDVKSPRLLKFDSTAAQLGKFSTEAHI
jgi:hypothetical protein